MESLHVFPLNPYLIECSLRLTLCFLCHVDMPSLCSYRYPRIYLEGTRRVPLTWFALPFRNFLALKILAPLGMSLIFYIGTNFFKPILCILFTQAYLIYKHTSVLHLNNTHTTTPLKKSLCCHQNMVYYLKCMVGLLHPCKVANAQPI